MRRILLALGLLFLAAATSSVAAELQLGPRSGSAETENATDFLRDPGGTWTLRDVLARQAAFARATTLVPDVRAWALSPSTLWFRLQPRASPAGPWYLHASYALDAAEMYYVRPDGRVTRTLFGTLVPYSKRQLLSYALAERIRRLRGERDAFEVEALVDALTGIANRRAFDRRLAGEWRRGMRGATQLAIIMIDVDHFKSYNDAYGHLAGDAALKVVARAITSSVRRADDFVARYGGEEFAVLLPYSSSKAVVEVADTIRAAVASLGLTHADNPSGRLTVSAGTSVSVPAEEFDSQDIVRAADDALYAAKRAGRNRVATSSALVA